MAQSPHRDFHIPLNSYEKKEKNIHRRYYLKRFGRNDGNLSLFIVLQLISVALLHSELLTGNRQEITRPYLILINLTRRRREREREREIERERVRERERESG